MDNRFGVQAFHTDVTTEQLERLYEIAAELDANNIKAAVSFFETLLKK